MKIDIGKYQIQLSEESGYKKDSGVLQSWITKMKVLN
ncbi:MAG: hypothetical protein ACJA1A_002805 [Saprospiraceae bacterium]|jgi:hypothetical protein|tara:strand:- start:404 stop:514 length:111 start_codon:yes stop_codon:yes gene_type:complete